MIKLNYFGMNRSATAIGHYEPVKAKHHSGMAFDLAGHVNLRDVTVDSCVLVFPLVNDGCAERITHVRIDTGQCVV
jgi:hypothetical protein